MNSSVTIGRSHSCDIVIDNPYISGTHARVSLRGGEYVFENLGRNGSFYNGVALSGAVSVRPNAPIMLAGQVALPWRAVLQLLPQSPVNGNPVPPRPARPAYAYQPSPQPAQYAQPAVNNEIGINFGFGLLSFCFPIVGWILYFVWRRRMPRRARQAAMWAWIGFAVNATISTIYYIILLSYI